SLQTLELRAVIWALQHWNTQPINIVSDSLYVVGIVSRIERAMLHEVSNKQIASLLQTLLTLNNRQQTYFITHIRSHLMDKGLAIGNNKADQLVAPAWTGPSINIFEQAKNSHAFFHQSAKMLARQFQLSLTDAQGIVKSCPACKKIHFGIGIGVNPKGLRPLQIWQMDVTHISEFGHLKYLRVVIDTFSMVVWATAQTGETTKHVEKHLYASFAALGVPITIKTDNGSAYVSCRFQQFCLTWGIRHVTGIPHSPTGQAMVERAHQTLKNLLIKQ
ncbi:hypothetical protein M959_08555, partial [Chaetura pelagica]